MAACRINLRFKKDSNEDMKAWDSICKYAKDNNCSMNRAVISIVNKYTYGMSELEVDSLIDKISKIFQKELKKHSFSIQNYNSIEDEEDNLDIMFDFLDELGI